jgi:hypothetical protein
LWSSVPGGDKLLHGLRFDLVLFGSEVEQIRKWLAAWKTSVRVAQLVEIWIQKTRKGSGSLFGIILK